jgi:WD40 repeat protein/tRNA A-37 threonylcarbamoyl transferase component Bud32
VVAGRYKLLERIGEGGMGEVWMAEQTEPVRRRVALKLIKQGMDSRAVLARFEAERQALALMDHPNIARVLDAGATEADRPFFVMELVKGTPITKYCDDHKLTPQQRLDLFVQVCAAVQHAHQKGVIHRDIKPSNVLVAPYDGVPVPKVIDFGIAKAAGQPLTEKTLFTAIGAVVGTPEYMSPEQAELNNADVDTRSDVYSLGVLLYELLTGTTPLTRKRLKEAALLEVLRLVREEEPPRPSTRLSTTDELPTVAANRGLEPRKLSGLVRGELDWIVMRALEKDRARRYATANGLGEDVRRYLADEPVAACPPSAAYRLRKFARRNKVVLTTAAVVAAALVAAVAVLAVSLVIVDREQTATRKANEEREDEHLGRIAALEVTEKAKGEREREYRGRIAALEGEKLALAREKQALEGWRLNSYYMATAAALNEYRTGNLARAAAILDECPEDLRHWEWHYVRRLLGSELAGGRLQGRMPTLGTTFSPDAGTVALMWKGRLAVYDLPSGREIPEFRDSNVGVGRAFSADGRRLAVSARSGGEQVVRVRDVATREVVATLKVEADAGQIKHVALSPDGTTAAATSGQGKVYVWDVASGKQTLDFAPHGFLENPRANYLTVLLSFSPDGGRLVTASERDPVARSQILATGKQVLALDPGQDGYSTVVWAPKGGWVAAASVGLQHPDLSVRIWDATTGRMRHVLLGHTQYIYCMAVSPDGRRLATGGDRRVMLWDAETGLPLATYCGHAEGVSAVSFAGEGKRLVSLDLVGVFKTWDATRAPEYVPISYPGSRLEDATFSPDGRLVAGSLMELPKGPGPPAYRVRVWDAGSGRQVAEFDPQTFTMFRMPVTFSSDGRLLATAGYDMRVEQGQVRIWDMKSRRLAHSLPAAGDPPIGPCLAVALSPDGRLAAAGGGDWQVHVWDLATGAEKFRLAHLRSVSQLRFSRDGRRLASWASGVWMRGPEKPAGSLIKGDVDSNPFEVKVWDMATGAELYSLKRGPSPYQPLRLEFEGDGDRVVITDDDGTARVYDLATRTEVATRKNLVPRQLLWDLSPDGQRVVTSDVEGDYSVAIWEAKTGRPILTIGQHTMRHGMRVVFSPDGRRIMTADWEGIRVWDATPLKQ